MLDTLEALFGELPNPGIVRSEIRRLFNWLKEKGLTTVITAERDQADRLTRHGIEEFVSDCVILLDHRIREEISTRRLRIVKYRGSTHGTNEYPFLLRWNQLLPSGLSCVGQEFLVNAAVRDALLRLAEPPHLDLPSWSQDIMQETRRTLGIRLHLTPAQTAHLTEELETHFADAWVEGYEALIPAMKNHPKDRHVLAAAVRCRAQMIVTFNLKDFPAETDSRPGMLKRRAATSS